MHLGVQFVLKQIHGVFQYKNMQKTDAIPYDTTMSFNEGFYPALNRNLRFRDQLQVGNG